MRNIGNAINPLNRFGGMNVIRGFGRSVSSTPPPAVLAPAAERPKAKATVESGSSTNSDTPGLKKVTPAVQRFLDVSDPGDLKISEVGELLNDYRRLVGALKDLGAF